MAWLMLVVAGLLEVGWAIGLKASDGFSRPLVTIFTIAAIVGSMVLLGLAARTLPIGSAYAIWVGIGAVGAGILGILLFDEPATAGRIGFLALLVVAIIGLRLTTPETSG